jgi:hypothetical protein
MVAPEHVTVTRPPVFANVALVLGGALVVGGGFVTGRAGAEGAVVVVAAGCGVVVVGSVVDGTARAGAVVGGATRVGAVVVETVLRVVPGCALFVAAVVPVEVARFGDNVVDVAPADRVPFGEAVAVVTGEDPVVAPARALFVVVLGDAVVVVDGVAARRATFGASSVGSGVPMTDRVAAETPIQIARVARRVAPSQSTTEMPRRDRGRRGVLDRCARSSDSVTGRVLTDHLHRHRNVAEPSRLREAARRHSGRARVERLWTDSAGGPSPETTTAVAEESRARRPAPRSASFPLPECQAACRGAHHSPSEPRSRRRKTPRSPSMWSSSLLSRSPSPPRCAPTPSRPLCRSSRRACGAR